MPPSWVSSLPPTRLERVRLNAGQLPAEQGAFLGQLVGLGLVEPSDRETFLAERVDRLREYTSNERLGYALIQAGLLTAYQLDRVLRGEIHGLLLGSYCVREELGRGGMGTVYLAQHRVMKRHVAIKVVPCDEDVHPSIRQRFCAEMRVLAELSHPNIVLALDAGEVAAHGRHPALVYMVLELVKGGDLERLVTRQGVCSVSMACSYARQAAAGLQAAHDRHLIHRDLKPSNLLLSESGQIKLVDFGLARQFSSCLTDQRALLGSVEFMPPEQSHDPSAVGKEADIYGLGATLFWLLTGEGPYPYAPQPAAALRQLQQQEPRRLRSLRRDVPVELDELVSRMLDRNPANRPATPLAVMNALRPFLLEDGALPTLNAETPSGNEIALPRLLVVHDDADARWQWRHLFEQLGWECGEAASAATARDAASQASYDLVLLDLKLAGPELAQACLRLREASEDTHLKILAVREAGGEAPRGVDDCLERPVAPGLLLSRAKHALALKAAQDRVSCLTDQLLAAHGQLEQAQRARLAELDAAHDALLFAMAKVAESRDGETQGHLERMKAYCRVLALAAAEAGPPWEGLVDDRFLRQLERCVPLHDIGKIGLSDEILLKPASLTPAERILVQTHAVLGDGILESLASVHGAALAFLGQARAIVRHHHERWDGKGYPDRLVGDAIPPAARLVAVADVYDALRRLRMYKPAMTHQAAISLMLHRSAGQFDPSLVAALQRCHGEFERIYREIEE